MLWNLHNDQAVEFKGSLRGSRELPVHLAFIRKKQIHSSFMVNIAVLPREGWEAIVQWKGRHGETSQQTTLEKQFANRKRSQKDKSQHCQLGETMKWQGYLYGSGGEKGIVSHLGRAEVRKERGQCGVPPPPGNWKECKITFWVMNKKAFWWNRIWACHSSVWDPPG